MSWASTKGATEGGKPMIQRFFKPHYDQLLQQHVAEIQKQVDLIQKQSSLLEYEFSQSDAGIAAARGTVQLAMNSARKTAVEANASLIGMCAETKGISPQDMALRKAQQQGLTENMGSISLRLVTAFQEYERAEAAAQRQRLQRAEAAAQQPSRGPNSPRQMLQQLPNCSPRECSRHCAEPSRGWR